MHFRVTGEWNGEPFNRVIEAEDINAIKIYVDFVLTFDHGGFAMISATQ